MEPSARLPLAPRQKLSSIGSTVAQVAVTVGTGVGGSLIATWGCTKAIKPRLKAKNGSKKIGGLDFTEHSVRIATVEEHILRVRKTTIVTVNRLKNRK